MNWVLFGLILGGILLIPVLFKKNRVNELPLLSNRLCTILLVVLFFIFAFLLVYRVDEIPTPYHVDEAGMVYDAKSLASYGIDRWGYRYPVYFINYGGGQSALYMYLAVAAIKLFGYSIISVRLPAVILSLLSAVVFAMLIRAEYGNFASATAMAVFCFLPFSVMHSRWGLDAYLLFPMLIFSCSVFFLAVRKGSVPWFFLSGFLFGLSLYAYAVSYILIPLFLGSLSICLLVQKNIGIKQLAALWFPVSILAVPLVLLLCVNNGFIDEIRTSFFSIPRLFFYRGEEFSFENIFKNLEIGEHNLFYNIFVWDSLRYNLIPKFGSMHYFTIPLIIAGLILSGKHCISSLRQGRFTLNVLMIFLFVSVFVILLLLPYNNVNRSCAVFFPLIYFLAAGVLYIIKNSRISAIAAGILFLIFGSVFVRYYFIEFPKELVYELPLTSVTDLKEALEFADGINHENEPITIYGLGQSYLYTLLVEDIDPYTFNETKTMNPQNVLSAGNYLFDVEQVSPERVYLVRSYGWVPEEIRNQSFHTADFGTITVYYPEQ